MTTFRQFIEAGAYSTPQGGHLYSRPYPSMAFTSPSDYTTPETQKAMRWAAWEMGVLDKMVDLVTTGHQPIIISSENDSNGQEIYRYWLSESDISKKWHPQAIEMLKQRGIISKSPSDFPVIDYRNQQEHYACHEINVAHLKSVLSTDVGKHSFISGLKNFGINALNYSGYGRLPASHGTTILSGR